MNAAKARRAKELEAVRAIAAKRGWRIAPWVKGGKYFLWRGWGAETPRMTLADLRRWLLLPARDRPWEWSRGGTPKWNSRIRLRHLMVTPDESPLGR
jgi:hypothetical protein